MVKLSIFLIATALQVITANVNNGLVEGSNLQPPGPASPEPPAITTPPTASHPHFFKRQTKSMNTCAGWSVAGLSSGIDGADRVKCEAPGTCTYGKIGQNNYWACATDLTAGLDWATACEDYPNTSSRASVIYCRSDSRYCVNWLMSAPSIQYTQFQCMNNVDPKSSRIYTILPGYETIAAHVSNPATTVAATTIGVTGSSIPTSTQSVTATTRSEATPQPTTQVPQSSTPTGINLAAAIAGTLGGVGSFVAGAIAVHTYLKKKRAGTTEAAET